MKQGIPFVKGNKLYAALVAIVLLALTGLLGSQKARADELKLKDGTKISGTIVGFEQSSFKVKTSYGFAVVQKDQVVSISMSDAVKPASKKKPDAAGSKPSAPEEPKTEPANAAASPEPSTPISKATPQPALAPAPAREKSVARPLSVPAPVTAALGDPKSAGPEPIREEVTGNTYTNDTYRFRMYKPPDWDVIVAARALLPGAIAAMGTNDETTYLLIGQEPAGKSPATELEATELRLRNIMDNFRPLDDKQITVSGISATEHRFRGSVDAHDWSGVVVLLPRGTRLYPIFGMTRADSDLVQIQENVIARTISSLEFTEQ
jgi:type IV secretory pathway VirB10-like protein